MNYGFIRRIRQWLLFDANTGQKDKGALTLLSVFVFVVFSTLGLSMLYLTQIYLKISAYRKNSLRLDFASENGIKQGFNQLTAFLSPEEHPSVITEDKFKKIKADVGREGNQVVQELLGCELPLGVEGKGKGLAWRAQTDFSFYSVSDREDYFWAFYRAAVCSTGRLENFDQERNSVLEAMMDIHAGHVPLPVIPVLLDRKVSAEEKRRLEKQVHIESSASGQNSLPSRMAFSEGDLLPQQASSQLSKALNINIFYPQDLSARKLRTVLGLEPGDEPVPDGVYLIENDMGLGGVFVQGDVDEMVLAIQANYQVILFRKGQSAWILKFSPEEGRSVFITPEETKFYDLIPLGMVVVNGKIQSLGGGTVNPANQVTLVKEEQIPCLLQGVNLTIISSDQITLSSHLIYQGVKWEEGVPYLKNADSQLLIFAAGKDVVDGSEKEGGVLISASSPEELKIQASLTASGKGISVEGEDKEVQVLGSVHASGFFLNGSSLHVHFDQRFFQRDERLQNAPKVEKPVLYPARFYVTAWREN